jgi:hypothetical protein
LKFNISDEVPEDLQSADEDTPDEATRKLNDRQQWDLTNIATYDDFRQRLRNKFKRDEKSLWREIHAMFSKKQQPNQSAESFINEICELGQQACATDDQMRHAILNGMTPSLVQQIIHHPCDTIDNLKMWANTFEACHVPPQDNIAETVRSLADTVEKMQVRSVEAATSEQRRRRSPSVRFAPDTRDEYNDDYYEDERHSRGREPRRQQWLSSSYRGRQARPERDNSSRGRQWRGGRHDADGRNDSRGNWQDQRR